jgi:hypothetical protein
VARRLPNVVMGTARVSGGLFRNVVTTRVTGVPQSIMALRKYQRLIQKGLNEGHRDAMGYLLTETRKVTPYRTGKLRRSGKVEMEGFEMKSSRFLKRASIVFTESYAVYVHEDLEAWHAPGTYAKFLERTINDPRHRLVAATMIARGGRKYV